MEIKNWSKEKIEKDKPYWVGFNVFPGVGTEIFGNIVSYFGTAKDAWGSPREELLPILGRSVWDRFCKFRREFEPEKYTREICIRGIGVLIVSESGYPALLREIDSPPPVLYVRGNQEVLSKPQIAVVGSRKMTEYGKWATRELVSGLAGAGLVVTSGLAFGVDTEAHRTAIESGGETIAVLGCGVDICYPAEHIGVYEEIVGVMQEEIRGEDSDSANAKGAVVSEIPVGVRTNRGIFVARNRIISGMSLGVLVVEGEEKSGTLITAGYAVEQGRPLFAVPGPITSKFSKGPNKLIAEGAKPVREVEDILSELKIVRQNFEGKKIGKIKNTADLPEDERRIVEILLDAGGEGVQVDSIVRKSGIGGGEVGAVLGRLEIKGIARRGEGGRYYVV